MKLKGRYAKKADIPAGQEEFYVELDGEWVLEADLEDHPSTKGLRNALAGEKEDRKKKSEALKALQDQLGDMDLDQAKELLKQAQQQREKKLIDAGKVDELVAEKITAMKAEYEKQLGSYKKTVESQTSQLEHLLITSAIQAAASAKGVRKTALDDVVLRGKAAFKVKDGKAVRMDGENIVNGKSGTDPMGVDEWVEGLIGTAPHLFEESKGGGAGGSGAGNGGGSGAGSPKVISSKDPVMMGKYAKEIAEGKVLVDMGSGTQQ